MPMKPMRRCPGCKQLVSGPCRTCYRERSRARGTTTEQGYGTDWQKLRAWHWHQYPNCQDCEARGLIVMADDVHHVDPFEDLGDRRRLDRENLRSLCRACHNRLTHGRQPGVSNHQQPQRPERMPGSFLLGHNRGDRG